MPGTATSGPSYAAGAGSSRARGTADRARCRQSCRRGPRAPSLSSSPRHVVTLRAGVPARRAVALGHALARPGVRCAVGRGSSRPCAARRRSCPRCRVARPSGACVRRRVPARAAAARARPCARFGAALLCCTASWRDVAPAATAGVCVVGASARRRPVRARRSPCTPRDGSRRRASCAPALLRRRRRPAVLLARSGRAGAQLRPGSRRSGVVPAPTAPSSRRKLSIDSASARRDQRLPFGSRRSIATVSSLRDCTCHHSDVPLRAAPVAQRIASRGSTLITAPEVGERLAANGPAISWPSSITFSPRALGAPPSTTERDGTPLAQNYFARTFDNGNGIARQSPRDVRALIGVARSLPTSDRCCAEAGNAARLVVPSARSRKAHSLAHRANSSAINGDVPAAARPPDYYPLAAPLRHDFALARAVERGRVPSPQLRVPASRRSTTRQAGRILSRRGARLPSPGVG